MNSRKMIENITIYDQRVKNTKSLHFFSLLFGWGHPVGLVIAIVFAGLLTAGCASIALHEDSESKYFEVLIDQNGQTIPITNNAVELKKEPFTIIFLFKKPLAVESNFSFDDLIYRGFKEGKKIDEILENPENFMGMAEEQYNPDEEIIINNEATNYWHYKDDTDHRFSSISRKDGYIICKRKVSFYRDANSNADLKIPIQELKWNHNIYMSILYSKRDSNGKKIEKQKDCILLKFKEDYSTLFPSPLKGWKASDVAALEPTEDIGIPDMPLMLFDSDSVRIKLSRTYSGLNHNGKFTIDIDNDDCWMSANHFPFSRFEDKIKKTIVLEPFTYKSYKGAKVYDNKKRFQYIVLNIGPCGVLVITADTFERGGNIAMDYLQATDLQKISAFMNQY